MIKSKKIHFSLFIKLHLIKNFMLFEQQGSLTIFELWKRILSINEIYFRFSSGTKVHIETPKKKVLATHMTHRIPLELLNSYLFEALVFSFRDYNPKKFYKVNLHPYQYLLHSKIQNKIFSLEYVKLTH